MHRALKDLARGTLQNFNIGITSYDRLQELTALEKKSQDLARLQDDLKLLMELPHSHSSQLVGSLHGSKSQLRQDLFVLSHLDFKRNGFFVEFGATNGVDLSNTYLLEKEFGWTGILAEPAKHWHQDLKANRSSFIETSCVWRDSGSLLNFNEALENAELSTVESYSSSDLHAETRKLSKSYQVKTISLEDLLDKYKAPREIDYLSIDTEGTEYEILGNFNFDKYRFKVITCEHNHTPLKEQIFDLLSKNGYVRTLENVSQFDDWYVLS